MLWWQWLEQVLFYLAIVNLGFTTLCALCIAWSINKVRWLKDVPIPETAEWPSVALIAPARNEERNIEAAIRSLVRLDYPRLEITLVNDRSTDGTGAILDRLAAEFPQLNVVHLTELPPGWLGKNHALQLGAERSNTDWLLFTDADILFEPTALKRAIAYAQQHGVDHLAGLPFVRMPSWLLQAFVVTFGIYFTLYTRTWAVRNPRSTAHIGVGAFNLVKSAVYRAVGGHERIRMRPDDDLKLGKIIKLGGHRQDAINAVGMITVDWYHSTSEMIRGLEKNAFSGTDYNVFLTVFSASLSLLFNVWPYLAVFLVPGPTRWIYAGVCLVLWGMACLAAKNIGAPPSCGLAFPVGALLMTYIQWRTMLLNYYHNGIRWRDTHYSLAELRANKV